MMVSSLPFVGQHCETTATGTLLNHLGIELSEPMLFGLGEGLSFLFWNMKSLDFPFLGGRIKPDLLTQNIAKNLGLKLDVRETTSTTKAWKNVAEFIDTGVPVGLKLDCFHLEYFSKPFHFAGHYVAMLGYDENDAMLVDTQQQGTKARTSLTSLASARSEKGPMSSRNLSYTISGGDQPIDVDRAVIHAARANAFDYLNPPISNVSYRGIAKTAKEIPKWIQRSPDIKRDFGTTAMLMEFAGTGGAIFRNLYRDFLRESFQRTGEPILRRAHEDFAKIASDWSEVIRLLNAIADGGGSLIADQVCHLLVELSDSEREAMERLSRLD